MVTDCECRASANRFRGEGKEEEDERLREDRVKEIRR
jgi:hypothetical protein